MLNLQQQLHRFTPTPSLQTQTIGTLAETVKLVRQPHDNRQPRLNLSQQTTGISAGTAKLVLLRTNRKRQRIFLSDQPLIATCVSPLPFIALKSCVSRPTGCVTERRTVRTAGTRIDPFAIRTVSVRRMSTGAPTSGVFLDPGCVTHKKIVLIKRTSPKQRDVCLQIPLQPALTRPRMFRKFRK